MHTNASCRHIASSSKARITGPKARALSRRSARTFTAAIAPAIESLESRRLLTGTLPTMTLEVIDSQANEAGTNDAIVRFTRTGGDITQPIHATFDISSGGTATYLTDYFFANESSFSFGIAAGQAARTSSSAASPTTSSRATRLFTSSWPPTRPPTSSALPTPETSPFSTAHPPRR